MAVPVIASSTAFSVSGSVTLVMTKPTGLAVGDLLRAQVSWTKSATGTPSLPSGWAIPTNGAIAWDSTTQNGIYVAYKVADAADVAATNFSFGVSGGGTNYTSFGIIERVTGADTSSPIDGVAQNTPPTSGTTGTWSSVTTTVNDALVTLYGYQYLANTNPSGSQFNNVVPSGTTAGTNSNVVDGSDNEYSGTAYFTQAAAGATGTKTVTISTASSARRFKAITIAVKPASGGYSMAGGSGSYSLSGSANALKRNRTMAADAASYSLSGTAAALRHSYPLAAATAVYTISGAAVVFPRSRRTAANTAAYLLVGSAAALYRNRALAAASSAFNLNGSDVTLTKNAAGGYTIVGGVGAYVLAGTSISLKFNPKLAAGVGVYSLIGAAAVLSKTRRLAPNAGAYAQNGSAALFPRSYRIAIASGVYTIGGGAVSLEWSGQSFWRPIAPSGGSWSASTPGSGVWTPVAANPETWTPQ